MKDKKKIVIGTLCALVMIMAVGYALLSQQLSINGSASITSNWQVEITNIREKEKSTGTTTNSTNYTATTASFNTSLTSPGDYALYEVTVTNKGTLDAVLSAKPTITTGNNETIQYELEGIKKGDKILKNNQTDTFTIKVQYNPNTTTQPTTLTSNIEVTLNYEQDLGQVGTYDEYVIGNKITFAGSDWYVIKNSTDKDDYVTLLKEKILTASELGEFAYEYTCSQIDANYHVRGCTNTGEVLKIDEAIFDNSNSNVYSTSNVKRAIEAYASTNNMMDDLAEVDNYKIRLLKYDELDNLGYAMRQMCSGSCWEGYGKTENTPKFVVSDFGSAYSYWTMTPDDNDSARVWLVSPNSFGALTTCRVGISDGVRPVINLYKSAIE